MGSSSEGVCQQRFYLQGDSWKTSDLSILCSFLLEVRFPEKILLTSYIERTCPTSKILEPCEGRRLEMSTPIDKVDLNPHVFYLVSVSAASSIV